MEELADELNAYSEMKRAKQHGSFPTRFQDRGIGAQILRSLHIKNLVLLSNSEQPTGPVGYGLTIQRIEPIQRA